MHIYRKNQCCNFELQDAEEMTASGAASSVDGKADEGSAKVAGNLCFKKVGMLYHNLR